MINKLFKTWQAKLKGLLLLLFFFLVVKPALADINLEKPIKSVGQGVYGAGTKIAPLPFYIGVYVKTFIYMVGVILVVVIVYAGYLWMTAGGNEEQVAKAKKWISNGIVGMILALSAFALTDYILARIGTASLA